MFVKVFAQILDSSIADNYLIRFVFEDFLKLASKDGIVDMTPSAISRRTGVPLDIVLQGIEQLSQPDPQSRSTEAEGRRILPLDAHRSWGWRIVNYMNYRNIRDEEDRKTYFRDRKRAQRARKSEDSPGHVFDGLGQSSDVTQEEAEEEVNIPANADASTSDLGFELNLDSPIRHLKGEKAEAVYKVFRHYLDKTGRHPKLYEFTDLRKKKGMSRLDECLKKTSGDLEKARDLMIVAVDALSASDWHMGRNPKTEGKHYKDWIDNLFGTYELMEGWLNR